MPYETIPMFRSEDGRLPNRLERLASQFPVVFFVIAFVLFATPVVPFNPAATTWSAEHRDLVWGMPPGWVFGAVWTTLYVLKALAATRVHYRGAGVPAALYALVTVGSLAEKTWTALFFGPDHAYAYAALAVLLLIDACNLVLLSLYARKMRVAAALWLPYVLWSGFATYLNVAWIPHLPKHWSDE